MTVKLLPEFDWFLEPKFKELKDKMFKGLATLKGFYPPRKGPKMENQGTPEDNTDNTSKVTDNDEQPTEIPNNVRNDDFSGDEKPFNPPNENIEESLKGAWSCSYCEITNRVMSASKPTRFLTLGHYEKHIMDSHRRLTFDPEPKDLERFESDFKSTKSNAAEMAVANLAGNGLLD
jgi:hypothetical protein